MSSSAQDRREVERDAAPRPVKAGRDEKTLLVALGGTMLVIAIAFAVTVCLVVTAYLLAR
jgi:hypothetical protein